MKEKITYSEEEWRTRLTPEAFAVCRQKGTEKPFSGKYVHLKDNGVFACVACGNELFDSSTKFDSGTGWPSFFAPKDNSALRYEEDRSHGMVRAEVMCARCDSHLGHVFEDGPSPTEKRYCINSAALAFRTQK